MALSPILRGSICQLSNRLALAANRVGRCATSLVVDQSADRLSYRYACFLGVGPQPNELVVQQGDRQTTVGIRSEFLPI